MSAWVVSIPAAVMVSSFLFIDGRRTRWLGFALLGLGFVGIWTTVLLVVQAGEQSIAECASRGGVPTSGTLWEAS